MKRKMVSNEEPSRGSFSDDEEEKEAQQHQEKGAQINITEYEKQRLQRIEENQVKLAALGLPSLASSLPRGNNNRKSAKFKVKRADDDYQPSTEDEQSDEETEQKLPSPKKPAHGRRTSAGRPRGKKMKSLNSLTSDIASKGHGFFCADKEVDDDVALQQALALSMGVSIEDAAAIADACKEDSKVGKAKEKVNEVPRGKKQRRQAKNVNAIQLTEDEVIALFFFFDEAGKGKITLRDLERVAVSHDFTWTGQEISEMINAFDKDWDGQLTLDEFQTIVTRCNMIVSS